MHMGTMRYSMWRSGNKVVSPVKKANVNEAKIAKNQPWMIRRFCSSRRHSSPRAQTPVNAMIGRE